MVTLEVECNIAKRVGVAVDIKRSHVGGTTAMAEQLFAEKVREVRGCS